MIPINGYASFHPLKHCWIGSGFRAEWFDRLFKDKKIIDPLKRIADETEEDYQKLEQILKSLGVKTYRSVSDEKIFQSLKEIYRPPINPRDHFAIIGKKIYCVGESNNVYKNVLEQIDDSALVKEYIEDPNGYGMLSTATIARVGKDLFWDIENRRKDIIEKYKNIWEKEGFRVHLSHRGYHSDGVFCVVKPGCIVSLFGVQNYKKLFPNWEVLFLPDQSWSKLSPFLKMKEKSGGKFWLRGEENNNELIHFVNTWLRDWVGYVEETVFDVNMLSIDENTIICNNYNKEVFNFLKKHHVEPVVFNFRHRYFWDSGVHCVTQDLYREGKMEDYF